MAESKVKGNFTEDKIKPIRITDKENGAVYELDFSRDSVKFAEERGFMLENVVNFPVTNLPLLFFYAFRKNHKNVPKNRVDSIYDRLGGLSTSFIERLMLLYDQAQQSNNVLDSDEDMGKNGNLSVEL